MHVGRKGGAVAVAATAIAVMAMAPAGASAKLRADYRFEGNFKSSVGNVPKLTKEGLGGEFKRQRVGRKRQGVWKFPEGTGLRMGQALKALGGGGTRYTFVMLVRLAEVDGYNKLIDFDNLQADGGLYIDDGALDGYSLDEEEPVVIQPAKWVQVALARSSDGTTRGFVNGKRIWTAPDEDPDLVLGIDEVLHFVMDDESTGTEEAAGSIARLRIWNNPLSNRAVKNLGK